MLASIQYPLQRNHMAMNYGNEVALCVVTKTHETIKMLQL